MEVKVEQYMEVLTEEETDDQCTLRSILADPTSILPAYSGERVVDIIS
jgi:hypothetical protein